MERHGKMYYKLGVDAINFNDAFDYCYNQGLELADLKPMDRFSDLRNFVSEFSLPSEVIFTYCFKKLLVSSLKAGDGLRQHPQL